MTDEPGKKNSSTVDHVKAWSTGGKTTDENSANACLSCNSSKGNRDLGTQWNSSEPEVDGYDRSAMLQGSAVWRVLA